MENNVNRISFDYSEDKTIIFQWTGFDDLIDLDDILQIDYSNITGDLITFPVLFNRISQVRAELERSVKFRDMELDQEKARLYKYHKSLLISNDKKATDKAIESEVILDPKYRNLKKSKINAEFDYARIDAIYWSAKDKSGKLNKLIEKIVPEEFESELIENKVFKVNGILVNIKDKMFKSSR